VNRVHCRLALEIANPPERVRPEGRSRMRDRRFPTAFDLGYPAVESGNQFV